MKKFNKRFIALISSLAIMVVPVSVTNNSTVISTYADDSYDVAPCSSLVFNTTSGSVSANECSATANLYGVGTVTIKVALQRQIGDNWYDYKNTDPGETFSNVLNATHKYPYTIDRSGSFRCRYTITGTVNGASDTITDYSAVLTIY